MLALILLIILGIDWASGYVIAGYCMSHGVDPYGYAFWQSFGPFVLLLFIQMLRRNIVFHQPEIFYAVLCGIFAIVIPNLLIYLSIIHIPSGLLTVIANISPIFTYIFAIIFRDEKFQSKRVIFVITGLIGIGLILLPNWHGLSTSLGSRWLYITLLIPLSYAFSAVYISKFRPGSGNVFSYALWMLAVASLCLCPLMVAKHGYYPLIVGDLNSSLIA